MALGVSLPGVLPYPNQSMYLLYLLGNDLKTVEFCSLNIHNTR